MSSESVLWVGAMASGVTAVGAFGSTWLASKLAHKNERKRTVEAANRDKLATLTYELLETTAKVRRALRTLRSAACDCPEADDTVPPNEPILRLYSSSMNDLKTQEILLKIYAPNPVVHATSQLRESADSFVQARSEQTTSRFWKDRSSELLFDYDGRHEVLISEVRKALHVDRPKSTRRRIASFARARFVKPTP